MTRNEKCILLRLIAKQIAENNGIICLSAGCPKQEGCSGMCENLRAELKWLSSELGERYQCNEISLAGRNLLFLMGSLSDPGNFNINDLIHCSDGWPAEEIWPDEEEQNEGDWGPEEDLLCEEKLADTLDDTDASKDTSPQDPRSMTIDELNLTVRAYNCMKRRGINTVGEITELTEADLWEICGMHEKVITDIATKLRAVGLDVKRES